MFDERMEDLHSKNRELEKRNARLEDKLRNMKESVFSEKKQGLLEPAAIEEKIHWLLREN